MQNVTFRAVKKNNLRKKEGEKDVPMFETALNWFYD